jgi:hypothetical protein
MAYTLEEVMQALRNADAAGDTESAGRLATIANQMRGQAPAPTVSNEQAAAQVPLQTTADPFAFGADVARQRAAAGAGGIAGGFVTPPLPAARLLQAAAGFPGAGTQAQKTVEEAAGEALGVRGLQPADESQQYMKSMMEGVLDPLNLAGPYRGIVSSLFGLTGRGITGGLAGFGGEYGSQVGQELGLGTAGTLGLSAAGAALGGATAIPTAVGTGVAKTIANRGLKSLASYIKGNKTLDGAQKEAEKKIANIFRAAIEADPNFASKFSQALAANPVADVPMPLSALLQNPIIDAELKAVAFRNPDFQTQYSNLFEQAQTNLQRKADNMFGMSVDEAVTRISNFTDPKIEKSVSRKLFAFDEAIKRASQLDIKETGAVGNRAMKLRDAKEEAVRQEMEPVYKEVFKQVEGQNVPAEEVGRIYDFVRQAKIDDIFMQLPAAERAVLREWAPKVAPTQYSDFGVVVGEAPSFSAVPMNQLDSLKKAVNKGLRTVTDREQFNKLLNLKAEVFTTAENISPEFAKSWKAADLKFAKDVGIPFDLPAIENMDRAKYKEQVVNKITQNKSSLSQFLSVIGENGNKVAEDAMTLRIYDSVIDKNTGLVDSKKLQQWRENRNNAEMLGLLPNLRNELYGREGMLRNIQNLERRKANLESNFTETVKTKILGVEEMTPKELVSKFYTQPKFIDEVVKRNGANQENLNALRTFVVDDIMSSPNPINTLLDKNKKTAYGKLFGPSWQNNIKNIINTMDLLRNNPTDVPVNLNKVGEDAVAKMFPGLNIPKVVSLWRNQIMSEATAIATAGSYLQAASSVKEKDKILMKTFLEPAKAGQLADILERVKNYKPLSKELIESIVKDFVSSSWSIPRGAAVGTQEPE